jgi:GNAT superfamily N-acetyltransferase
MPDQDGQAPPIVERAVVGDLDRLVEMFLADMADLGHRPDPHAMRRTTEQMLANNGAANHVFVARLADGTAVGVVLANEMLSIKFPGRALWIEELYVAPEARRLGVGRLLVEGILLWAKSDGVEGIELEAYRMNTAASILYRSIGFRRLARERYTFDLDDYEFDEDDDR